MSNAASILSILACLALGAIVALAGSPGSITFNGLPSFALAASIGFILHWLIFIPSYIYQTEHYFDLIGSISYISIVLFTFLALNNLDIRSSLNRSAYYGLGSKAGVVSFCTGLKETEKIIDSV